MNSQALYNGVTAIDPALVEEAAAVSSRPRILRFVRRVGALAACVALVAGIGYQMCFATAAKIYVTINPHVCVELNRLGGVTGLRALNEDGAALLDGYSYRSKDRVTVTEELIARARAQGYLTDEGQVTISIEAARQADYVKYDQEFVSGVAHTYADAEQVAVSVRNLLPAEEAQAIALSHFNLTRGKFTEIECGAEHDRAVYELEFTADGVEYDCTIDAVTGAVLAAEQEHAPYVPAAPAAAAYLTEAEARTIALRRAGLETAVFTQLKLDRDDGKAVYELEFRAGGMEYDCDVDAVTGAVLDYDAETDDDVPVAGKPATPTTPIAPAVTLTEEQAKAAALKKAGLTEAVFSRTELDTDDGRAVYELEFRAGNMEYDCEIDADTGAVVSYDAEVDDDAPVAGKPTPPTAPTKPAVTLTEEQAKAAALKKAGLTEAAFSRTELDTDDGRAVYELEFRAGNMEYDCEIDAVTGAVVSYDAEVDDDAPGAPTGAAAPAASVVAVTPEQAQAAALAQAGVNVTDVRTELDTDDGKAVYETEFIVDGVEYQCDVDAGTCQVIRVHAEPADGPDDDLDDPDDPDDEPDDDLDD